MPIYEYACVSCDHHLETLQKMSEDPLVFCPECGEESLRKKVSAAAFVLKGSGWYETDFKNSGKEKPKDAKAGDGQSASKTSSDTNRVRVPVVTLSRQTVSHLKANHLKANHLKANRSPRNLPLIRRQPDPSRVAARMYRRQTELSG